MSTEPFAFTPFDLPEFEAAPTEHWPAAISWDAAMKEFAATRGPNPSVFDSAEARLNAKNPEQFQMD